MRGLRILEALDTVAARLDATPAQVAIAWLMTRRGVTAPIYERVTKGFSAADFSRLLTLLNRLYENLE